jgi:transposase, IS5 family
VHKH